MPNMYTNAVKSLEYEWLSYNKNYAQITNSVKIARNLNRVCNLCVIICF